MENLNDIIREYVVEFTKHVVKYLVVVTLFRNPKLESSISLLALKIIE